MRALLIATLFAIASTALMGQTRFYGTVGVATYSATESTRAISVSLGNGLLQALQKEKKIKALGEVEVLREKPGQASLTNVFSKNKVDTLALIRVEYGNNESATFSVEVVQRLDRVRFLEKVARVGTVVATGIVQLSHSLAQTIVAFASKLKEVHVFLDILTVPPECNIQIGESDVTFSNHDGRAIFDGTRPVGSTRVEVTKRGYQNGGFTFEVPPSAGATIHLYERVQLAAAAKP